MSITDSNRSEVENLARAHEAGVEFALSHIGAQPFVKITVEDRLRGAIVAAMSDLKAGQHLTAYQELERALDL